ncbi:nitrous oxide reductase accessory protein NosL [Halorientalis regularis]|jgi:copper chaperone NosL|uniref:Nitrous oxide reductase accessory protein NosL n=1 Tax=Halorientalis regularis TaxID=660518 RepID=A0A1G7FPB6_9EURY|nr:nitrous oxide reductase accessory protein NosL [Halorientalis regularis]SDE77726.1 Nitrous oxide reductase accessory protein NosL [Halorientalis regularis]
MCDKHAHSKRSNRHDLCRRRTVLGSLGAVGVAALAGCSEQQNSGNGTADVPAAVTLTEGDTCDVCGMNIVNHPGPSAEVFYPDHQPSGHENPARFDSTWEAFQYDFERDDRGWERSVMYVTDYSAVEYDLFEFRDTTGISTHPKASAFAPASDVTFVANSEVVGAMGRDLIGFGDGGDASSFRDEHGGKLVTVDEVTPQLIAQLGR